MKTREIAVGGLLTALALLIPFAFRGTPLQLFIPTLQYSATFASHVPSIMRRSWVRFPPPAPQSP